MKTEREFLRHEATHAESSALSAGHKSKGVQPNKLSSLENDLQTMETEERLLHRQEPKTENHRLSENNHLAFKELGKRVQQSISGVIDENKHQSKGKLQDAFPTEETSKVIGRHDTSVEINQSVIDDVLKKAALYDEVLRRCEEMEKEIEVLKTKYDLSDSEDSDNDNLENEVKPDAIKEFSKSDDAYEISDSEVVHPAPEDDGMIWDTDDKTVPKNWTVGKFKDGKKGKIFKSPEGFVFQNRVKALEFMMHGSYPENFMSLMKNNLSEEGWVHDRSCPVRWKTRKIESLEGTVDYEYLSPTFEVIPSLQEMLEHAKEGGYELRIIKKLEDRMKLTRFEKLKTNQGLSKRKENKSKLEDDILPHGWTKKMIGQSNVFVSPEGTILHTIQQVLSAVENKQLVTQENRENLKPAIAEKRKSEDSFVVNKKGRTEVKQKSNTLSDDQVRILEEMHAKSLYPDSDNIKPICDATNLVESEVKKWFVKKAADQSRSFLKSRSRNFAGQSSPSQGRASPIPSLAPSDPHAPSLISQQHMTALNEIFRAKPNPSAENFKQIAERLGIERQIIVNWFKKKRSESQTELKTSEEVRHSPLVKSSVNSSADKNDIMTEDQVRALQLVLARTKAPSHQDYKALVRATGLSRLKIERWFNFHK